MRHEYDRAVQHITKTPWHALPTTILTRLKALRFPVEIRSIDHTTFEAHIHTVQRSHLWTNTLAMIATARDSDDARLDS